MIYTGPIDYFFDYKFGKLPYRSIRFEFENHQIEKYQDAAVINHVDADILFTRVTEYKYLTGQNSELTAISKEYSQLEGEPYYPVHTEENKKLYSSYYEETKKLKNVMSCGRLGEYKYYNMDQVVASSLKIFDTIIRVV
jgi:UDP-galactopyranose mutase